MGNINHLPTLILEVIIVLLAVDHTAIPILFLGVRGRCPLASRCPAFAFLLACALLALLLEEKLLIGFDTLLILPSSFF